MQQSQLSEHCKEALFCAFALLWVSPVAVCAQQFDLRTDRMSNATEGLTLGQPIDLSIAPNGDLVIVDLFDRTLTRVSNGGAVRWKVGRSGEGPGEFRLPYRAAVGPQDSIIVFDASSKEISWFDADGSYARRKRLPLPMSAVDKVALLEDGHVVVVGFVPSGPGAEFGIHVFTPDLAHIRSFGPVPPVSERRTLASWGVGGLDVTPEGNLLYTRRVPYEIYSFGVDGQRIGMLGPGAMEASPDDSYVESRSQGRIRMGHGSKFVPRPIPAMALGGGWILGGLLKDEELARWDVFGPDGRLLQELSPPNGWRAAAAVDEVRGYIYVRGETVGLEPAYFRVPYSIGRQ